MKPNFKFLLGLVVLSFLVGLVVFEPIQETFATPDKGSDCLTCHSGYPATKDNVIKASPSKPSTSTAAKQPAVTKALEYEGKYVAVTAYALNVRERGSAKAPVIGVLKQGEVVLVKEEAYGWLKIDYKGGTGWIYSGYVEPAATPAETPGPAPAAPQPAAPASGEQLKPAAIPSLNDQAMNSPLGSRHWNIFRNTYNNPADPEQSHCIGCHSAVKIVDDPEAQLTDFLKAGQEYCYDEVEDPVTGEATFLYATATEDGKYVDNNFEGITCRVCHEMNQNGLTLRRPDNTCTLCHGRQFDWESGSGHHVEQDFFEGHGESSWIPSVHYTLGMKCESCHTMNSIKHDYEPADPVDIVRDANCMPCHRNAEELERMIETTQEEVTAALTVLTSRIDAVKALIAQGKVKDDQGLVAKAEARRNFVRDDFSNGVHNPEFATQLINEAYGYLNQFD